MSSRVDEQITLAGPPRNTSAILRLDAGGARVAMVALKVGQDIAMHKAYLRPFGAGAVELRLRLPRETPPGSYSGELAVGERKAGVRVEVESVLHVRVHPHTTRLAIAANGSAEFTLAVENRGNVPIELPKAALLDLQDEEGQGRALGRALRATLPERERRVDRFFEELREQHGGQARLTLLAGAGRLLPADARQLRCRLELPESVRAGRTYGAAWELGDQVHGLQVEVTSATPVIREGRPQ